MALLQLAAPSFTTASNSMTRRRLLFAFLDHCIVCLIGVPLWWLIDKLVPTEWLGITVVGLIYLNKDCLQGRSPAKRILGFEVVEYPAGLPVSPSRCALRNITILLWPIEIIMLLINPNRRIGDYLAGTECVKQPRF